MYDDNIVDVVRIDVSKLQFHTTADELVSAEVTSISGQVLAVNRSNQTHLNVSGGSAYASSHNGHASASVKPVSIQSSNSVHDDVYILTETGEEVFVPLINWQNAGIRQGHYIQLIQLYIPGSKSVHRSSPYALINNRSLNRVLYHEQLLKDATNPLQTMATLKAIGREIGNPLLTTIGVILIVIFTLTVILIPFALGIFALMVKKLNAKADGIVNREIKPNLNQFLLPAVKNGAM